MCIRDSIVIYPVSAAEWDPSRFFFGSGNTEPFTQGSQTVNIPVQQQGADWSIQAGTTGTLYRAGAGQPELNFLPSLQASLNTVANAAAAGVAEPSTPAAAAFATVFSEACNDGGKFNSG